MQKKLKFDHLKQQICNFFNTINKLEDIEIEIVQNSFAIILLITSSSGTRSFRGAFT